MKSEQEVLEQIVSFAKPDYNVRAAVLNGSRANPNAPRDFMQDYDVALYVTDLDKACEYKKNQAWISEFGNLVILQQNNFDNGAFIFFDAVFTYFFSRYNCLR